MEKWKDIPGYEGLYQASTFGNIRTHANKTTFTELRGVRKWKQRVMKGRGNNKMTGKRVGLWKDGKVKDFLQARLIAMTWCEGYRPDLTVNHIDGNRFNNRIENLEWLTIADNIRHGFRTGLYKNNQKKTALIDCVTGLVMEFDSMASASRYLGKNKRYISDCLSQNRLRTGAFIIQRIA
jgi:hypothetical protein